MAEHVLPKSQRQYGVAKSETFLLAEAAGAGAAPVPKYIEPLLASGRHKTPSGDLWVHEIKYDGYRIQLHKSDAATKVYTRRGYDWSARFPTIVEGAWHLEAHNAVLDGEAVVLTEDAQTDFSALDSYVSSNSPTRSKHDLVFIAFDLLHLDGLDLRDLPLVECKRALRRSLRAAKRRSSTANT
jgi:bifunctional non-homologous end joining protein LigD